MQSPSSTIVLSMRDAFREMRYSVRREAGLIDKTIDALNSDLRARAPTLPAVPTLPVLRLADAVFGRLEKAANRAFSPERGEGPYAELRPVSDLVTSDSGQRRLKAAEFVLCQYRLAHAVLTGLGVGNLVLSEQAIETARQTLDLRQADLIGAVTEASVRMLTPAERAARVRFCAALTQGLAGARPIRRLDPPLGDDASKHLLLSPNLFCFAATGLALAIVSTRDLEPDCTAADVVEAALTVVDIRFARLSAAMSSRDPIAGLAREFESVLPHLP